MSYIKKKTAGTQEYNPRNPEKYKGEYPILARSNWELSMMRWLDSHNFVVSWSSEPDLNITYQDPITLKKRRYFPDFLFKMRDKEGKEYVYLIEVKPSKEMEPPQAKKGKKRTTLLKEQKNWRINKAKWNAARRYCKLRGWEFKFITEKQLYGG